MHRSLRFCLLVVLLIFFTTNSIHAATFTRNLSVGSEGSDVSQLQTILTTLGHYTYGEITGYYGQATQAAVQRYQCAKGIVCFGTPASTGYGAVGPKTRATLNGQGTVVSGDRRAQLLATIEQLKARLADLMLQLDAIREGNQSTRRRAEPAAESTDDENDFDATDRSVTSCNFNGNTIEADSSIVAYQASTVPYGEQCETQWRYCRSDGTLSGSYQFDQCTVGEREEIDAPSVADSSDQVVPTTPSQNTTETPEVTFTYNDRGIFVQDANSGTYYSRNEKTLADFKQRVDNALSLPYVSGFELVYAWSSFAPENEADTLRFAKYNYEPIDYALAKAESMGKKISIRIRTASFAPDYVMNNCPSYTFTHTHSAVGRVRTPVPWGECYTQYLNRMVKALASRYNGNPNIHFVSINGPSTLFGVETNWPMDPDSISASDQKKLDFSIERYTNAWKNSIGIYVRNFPDTQLALGLHNQIHYPGISQKQKQAAVREIRDYAIETYRNETNRKNKKLIIQLLGLTHANADYFPGPNDGTNKNLTDYISLVWEKRNNATIMYEWTRTSSNAGDSAAFVKQILENGISWGANAIDVKYPDVWDSAANAPNRTYQKAFMDAAQRLQ